MLHNTINCALFVHMLLLNCNLHFLHIAFHSVIKVVCAFFETTTNNTQKMRVVLFVQFILSKNIVDMLSDCFFITGKQNGHLIGTKPYGFIF